MSFAWIPRWLVVVLIVVIAVFILALIIGALGGFDWTVNIGHFHWNIGVTKGT